MSLAITKEATLGLSLYMNQVLGTQPHTAKTYVFNQVCCTKLNPHKTVTITLLHVVFVCAWQVSIDHFAK